MVNRYYSGKTNGSPLTFHSYHSYMGPCNNMNPPSLSNIFFTTITGLQIIYIYISFELPPDIIQLIQDTYLSPCPNARDKPYWYPSTGYGKYLPRIKSNISCGDLPTVDYLPTLLFTIVIYNWTQTVPSATILLKIFLISSSTAPWQSILGITS